MIDVNLFLDTFGHAWTRKKNVGKPIFKIKLIFDKRGRLCNKLFAIGPARDEKKLND